jgi:hypothetical protein
MYSVFRAPIQTNLADITRLTHECLEKGQLSVALVGELRMKPQGRSNSWGAHGKL